MARDLPSVGEVSYNGYTFPEAMNCKIRSVPIYDAADRARKYIQYTITIECAIFPDDAPHSTAGGQTDVNSLDLRKRLQSPGKSLTFSDQGFGSLTIDGTTVVDSQFGPKPRLLAWEPMGSNRACRIVWVCEVTIPECSSGTPAYHSALSEFTFSSSWTINESGMTTRTMRATIEVPLRIVGNGVVDVADNYISRFNPPVPNGFWRNRHRDESRGKNVIDITIIDTEIPSDNPYLPGAIKCQVRHRCESGLNDGFIVWRNTLSGTIEVAPGVSRALMWLLFMGIYEDRRQKGIGNNLVVKGLSFLGLARTSSVIMQHISVEEEIFGRELSLEVSWNTIGISLADFLTKCGLFSPVPGTSWVQWQGSVSNVQSLKGIANLGSRASDDLIIDLCQTRTSSTPSEPTKPTPIQSVALFSNPCPPPESSYIFYRPEIKVNIQHNAVQHVKLVPMSTAAIATVSEPINVYTTDFNPSQVTDNVTGSNPSLQRDMQVRGPADVEIILQGHAERYCYPVVPPKVVSFGGKTAYEQRNSTRHYVRVVSDTITVHGCYWNIEYKVNEVPAGNLNDTVVTNAKPELYSGNQ